MKISAENQTTVKALSKSTAEKFTRTHMRVQVFILFFYTISYTFFYTFFSMIVTATELFRTTIYIETFDK